MAHAANDIPNRKVVMVFEQPLVAAAQMMITKENDCQATTTLQLEHTWLALVNSGPLDLSLFL
jgi:hypothetical protein